MQTILKSLMASMILAVTPVDALATAGPNQPGYNPDVPSYRAPRSIWLRMPHDGTFRIDLIEANEPNHYDYLTVYGPGGTEQILTQCSTGQWMRTGVYVNTSSYLDRLTRTLCGNQIEP